jgi:hypothetical protein
MTNYIKNELIPMSKNAVKINEIIKEVIKPEQVAEDEPAKDCKCILF